MDPVLSSVPQLSAREAQNYLLRLAALAIVASVVAIIVFFNTILLAPSIMALIGSVIGGIYAVGLRWPT